MTATKYAVQTGSICGQPKSTTCQRPGCSCHDDSIKVGTVMIHVARHGAKPQTTNVDKVTKAGWIKVYRPGTTCSEIDTFKPTWRGYESTSSHSSATLHVFSDEQLAKLTAEHEAEEVRKAEKAAEAKARQDERAARLAAQLAEVKAACNGRLARTTVELPDGSRLVTLTLPVKPDLLERKGFEVAIIRLQDVTVSAWELDHRLGGEEKVKRVESHITYINGKSSSFPSCSGEKFANDEDACWEAARYCYNNSW